MEITAAIDSLTTYTDSVGRAMHDEIMASTYKTPELSKSDSIKIKEQHLEYLNTDSIFRSLSSDDKLKTLTATERRLSSLSSDWSMKSFVTQDNDKSIRSHRSDWHKK